MTRSISAWLSLILFLSACAPASGPSSAPTSTPLPERTATSAPPTSTPTRTPSPTPSPVPTPSRTASISLIENLVEARPAETEEFAPATIGQSLSIGGQARTGEESRARLDLLPDGTIIRLAPNSYFTLAKLEGQETNPFTLLELFFGKIFIILSGGELQAQTPSGVASVRGSMMSVSYDPDAKIMTVTCLEGHCSLRNDKGLIELVAGQAADIINGILGGGPRDLTDQELLDWLDNVPELNDRPDLLVSLKERLKNLLDKREPPRINPRRP